MKTSILLSVFFVMTSFFAFGHGGNGHKKKKTEESVTHSHEMGANTTHGHETKLLKADFDDFPTLHPLVVHFPIVLLLLAALAQLGSLLIFKHELSWVTMLLLLFGFTGAWLAGSIVHPHTSGLSQFAEKVLEAHEKYADYTLWIAGVAVLFKGISHFLLKRRLWAEAVVAMLLLGAAYSVSVAGHFGAQLIHIEGVGAQGNLLESHSGDGHDHTH